MSGVSEAQREHIWQEAAKVVMNPPTALNGVHTCSVAFIQTRMIQ